MHHPNIANHNHYNDSLHPRCTQKTQSHKTRKLSSSLSHFTIDLQSSQKLDQKTSGALTDRTDCTSLNMDLPQFQSFGKHISQTLFEETRIQNLQDSYQKRKEIVRRLGRIAESLQSLGVKIREKLLFDFSRTANADKYIRLIYSLLKIYRALNQNNRFSALSKELLNTRRIIQWETKYKLIKELGTHQLSTFEVGYKTFQLLATLFDFCSFWLHMFSKQSKSLEKLSQIFYAWQDDCYFYQCIVQLLLSVTNLLKHTKNYLKNSQIQEKNFDFQHKLILLTQEKQSIIKKINKVKNLKQKSNLFELKLSILEQALQKKLKSNENFIQKLICENLSQNERMRQKARSQINKSLCKTVKYVLDSITAFNNFSRKTFILDPLLGGVLSTISSIISLYLLWCW